VSTVGVFVDQPAEHVNGVAALVRLAAIQLHGSEAPAYAARVARPVIKSLSAPAGIISDWSSWPSKMMLLLDAHDPVRHGGTGIVIDWHTAAAVAARRRILLAGGLRPDNVADAIACVRPFGIDVSSGVEDAPGIKNHERLAALFKAIHGIDTRSIDASVQARS
jgi:phosphoribosylanthranilate isomerase